MFAPGKPNKRGSKVGDTTYTSGFGSFKYWEWNGTDWNEITRDKWKGANPGGTAYTSIQVPAGGTATGALRYPANVAMKENSDYVMFEFYEYQPPFQDINRSDTEAKAGPLGAYNESVLSSRLYDKTSGKTIVLYMPEDISTGYKANWSGKAFSNIGRDILTGAGSADLGQQFSNGTNAFETMIDQIIPNTGAKVIQEVIGKITGESIEPNDIFASTRGVILNPNVELLFSGIDLRNFSLNFKMVPRNANEATMIKDIVKEFKKAMLPKFAKGTELPVSTLLASPQSIASNFIRVPNVCRVSFMRGGDLNTDVPQYKMCAITQVDVNYTPDGAYATYDDGSMVAISLSLSFQETKLIFSEEADKY
jgi:hypothetical protein